MHKGGFAAGGCWKSARDWPSIEVFAGTTGLSIQDTHVRFLGQPMRLPVSTEMLGRVFDGLGTPIDGGPEPLGDLWRDINGQPINPTARVYPRDTIQTGISAMDGMNTLVLGQKLPIFSGSGLPHDQLAAQIVRQAALVSAVERRRSRKRAPRGRGRSSLPSSLPRWASSTTWPSSFANPLPAAAR